MEESIQFKVLVIVAQVFFFSALFFLLKRSLINWQTKDDVNGKTIVLYVVILAVISGLLFVAAEYEHSVFITAGTCISIGLFVLDDFCRVFLAQPLFFCFRDDCVAQCFAVETRRNAAINWI